MHVYSELGRYDDAAALFEIGRASDFNDLPFNVTWTQGISLYAECAVDLGRTDVAPLLYERLLPYAPRFIFVGSIDWGAVARPLGRLATLLGRYDVAEEHLRDALAMHARMQAPYWIAHTQLDLAELALTRRGPDDLDTARALIEEAQRSVDQYGYAGLQPRIDRLTDRA